MCLLFFKNHFIFGYFYEILYLIIDYLLGFMNFDKITIPYEMFEDLFHHFLQFFAILFSLVILQFMF